jgi:hypothetical protein
VTTGSERDYPDYLERNPKAWSDRDAEYADTMHAKWAGEAAWGISGRSSINLTAPSTLS